MSSFLDLEIVAKRRSDHIVDRTCVSKRHIEVDFRYHVRQFVKEAKVFSNSSEHDVQDAENNYKYWSSSAINVIESSLTFHWSCKFLESNARHAN